MMNWLAILAAILAGSLLVGWLCCRRDRHEDDLANAHCVESLDPYRCRGML